MYAGRGAVVRGTSGKELSHDVETLAVVIGDVCWINHERRAGVRSGLVEPGELVVAVAGLRLFTGLQSVVSEWNLPAERHGPRRGVLSQWKLWVGSLGADGRRQ